MIIELEFIHIQSDKLKDSIEKTQQKLEGIVDSRSGLILMSDFLKTLTLNPKSAVNFYQGDVIDPRLFSAPNFEDQIIKILEDDYWSFLVCGRIIQNGRITLYLAPVNNPANHNFYNYYQLFIGNK